MAAKVKRFEVRIELERYEQYRQAFEDQRKVRPDISWVGWIREALDIHARQVGNFL